MTNLSLDRASRNARTLAWLAVQPPATLDDVRGFYRAAFGHHTVGGLWVPLDQDEVPQIWDGSTLDDVSLAWVYQLFAHQIDRA